jgi:hypothetical protein
MFPIFRFLPREIVPLEVDAEFMFVLCLQK